MLLVLSYVASNATFDLQSVGAALLKLEHDDTDAASLNISLHDTHSPVADENDPGTKPEAQVAAVQSVGAAPLQLEHDEHQKLYGMQNNPVHWKLWAV